MSRTVDESLESYGRIISSPQHIPPLPLVYYLDDVWTATERRLTEKGPRSLVLVGPSGVGKTAVLRIVFGRLAAWHGATVLQTSTGLVMSGTRYLGDWQTRINGLVRAATAQRDFLLYFTDVNLLTQAGRSSSSTDSLATFLHPFLESGDITIVGESTPEELALGLARSPEFARLFRFIAVKEATRDETRNILKRRSEGRAPSDALVEQLLDLADTYVPDAGFPGKAIDLLEQSQQRLKREAVEREVGVPDLIETLTERTGLPGWLMDDRKPLDVRDTRAFFGKRVLGQREAVDSIVDLITLIKAGLTDPGKPFAVLLFVGPTGVGKTEIARALAEYLFGEADRMVRLDMSEYKTYEGYQRLIGTPALRSEQEEGILTRRVRSQPFSVVLFDEIEKAHPNVFDLLLAVFDDGRLTTARGQTVSFRQTIIILTSNLGSRRGGASMGFLERDSSPARRDVMRAVEDFFRPEFVNRIDRVVVFDPLDIDVSRRVAQRELEKVLRRSGIRRRDLVVDVDDSILTLLLQDGFSPIYGARPLKRVIERLVLLPLAKKLVSGVVAGSLLRVFAVDGKVRIRVLPPADDRPEGPPAAPTAEVDLGGLLVEIERRLAACRGVVGAQGLQQEKDRLLETVQESDFWRTPETARAALERVRVLDYLLGELTQAEDDAATLWRETGVRDVEVVRALRDRVLQLHLHLSLAGPHDSADAWLRLRRLDGPSPGFDPVRRMLDMYRGWAQRNGCEATVLDQQPDGGLVLWINGPHAFGLLRGEAGLHRFARRLSRGLARRSALVRVDVLPSGDSVQRPSLSDVVHEHRALKGGRSWARALHTPTLLVAECSSPLPLEANRDAVLDLLSSMAACVGEEPPRDVVRVFYLPEGEVRDVPTGVRVYDAERVLEGDLQRFILARCLVDR